MAAKYNLLLQERADLVQEGQRLLADIEGTGRDLAGAEKARDDELYARIQVIDGELRQIKEDHREAGRHVERVIQAVDEGGWGVGDLASPQRATGGRTFREIFGGPTSSPWKNKGEYLTALASGLHHDLLVPFAVGTIGIGSDGGFSVPEELVADMLDASLEDEIVRPRADVQPMASSTRKIQGFDASDSSSTLFGGFTGQWVPESGSITEESPRLHMIELKARKLAIFTKASNELAIDGLDYVSGLEKAIVKALSWFMDDAFLNGNGSGQPTGILNDPAIIAIAKEVGQAADSVVYENLTNMFARCHPASRQNSFWVASNTTIPQLAALSIAVGTGGSHIPVMTRGDGGFEILTRPVLFTEKVPALGDQGDISLVDFSQYVVGIRREMSLERSQHVGFQTDEAAFRGIIRADGQGKWSAAYTPKTGSTLSWAVTLAERA